MLPLQGPGRGLRTHQFINRTAILSEDSDYVAEDGSMTIQLEVYKSGPVQNYLGELSVQLILNNFTIFILLLKLY